MKTVLKFKIEEKTVSLGVSIHKEHQLQNQMRKLGIKEEELEEDFVRSSGPGGQNVNKVASCVFLRHRPTGISIKCQRFRSQGMNRFWARHLLLKAIEQKNKNLLREKIQEISKLRRQTVKRSRLAKEKMLSEKRFHAEKKKNRRSIALHRLSEI
jgi:protein subunit release factor B